MIEAYLDDRLKNKWLDGGGWSQDYSQNEINKLAPQLPLTITLECKNEKPIGISHTSCHFDKWSDVYDVTEKSTEYATMQWRWIKNRAAN
jgi:hypothetical protein